ncbi:unnamed protein product [Porites evermanni]|uniref:TIR domain-containing protein n=1 Tax=Porites evermanni TaxID=104178 RepID=A0ABN8STZ3_9CNID|nr:unnamed protein product [Porites evermanni]
MSAGTPEAAQFTTLLDFTVDVGGVEELKRFVQYCFEEYYVLAGATEAKSRKYRACCACLFDTLATIQNFADFHQGFCSACVNAGVISICLENVKRIDAENLDWEEGDEDSEPVIIIDNCLGILYNISQRFKNRDLFANSLETLLCLAKKKVREIAAHSLLTLAYLVNENTNHLLLAEETLLSFIITLLDEAWQSEERRSIGYSAKELAEGLSHLAVNDTNKKILGQKGATSVLISVIKTSSEDAEKVSAIKALWMLAFDDNNKKAIRQEDGAVGLLCHLQHSKDSQVQRAAAGALWEVEGKTARNVEGTESTGNHVMISYQWDSQEMLVEVKNRLQASGYRVWMDLEQMRGSTLEAMAKAVENSSVVLVCVSERYKESPNCRSEAEYAYQLRKDIIPLMMQRKYRGDGWLGMLVGTKLWFDFNSQQSIEPSVTKLIKELGGRGKDVDNTDEPSVTPVAPAVHSDDVDTEPSSPGVLLSLKDSIQSHMSVQDQRSSPKIDNEEIKEDVYVACVNTDLKASPNDTLETCIVKHPDKAENLITMLNRLQALKNFVDKNLNDPDDYATMGKLTLEGLFKTSSPGTPEAKQFTTLTEFIIDAGGAEKLKLFVQHCFKKYSYALTEETDDEEEPAVGYSCHHCLWFALVVILNFSDFHQGFCSACADAGVISMCFENAKHIDTANSNWEEEHEDSRELVMIIETSIADSA